jgi:uncharacterized protein
MYSRLNQNSTFHHIRKSFTLLLFCLILQLSFAQNAEPVRKIEVYGVAEMEVLPDEIYFVLLLKEYEQNNAIVKMDISEEQLLLALKSAKISKENLNPEGFVSRQSKTYGSMEDNMGNPDMPEKILHIKSFLIKVNSMAKMQEIISKIPEKAMQDVRIEKMGHSQQAKFQTQMQTEAIKNARQRANNLLQAESLALGEILEIQEIGLGYGSNIGNSYTAYPTLSGSLEYGSISQKVKIHSEVRVVFRIK